MFWTSEKSYYLDLIKSYENKIRTDDRKKKEKIIVSQVHLLQYLNNKSMKSDKKLLNEIAHISSKENDILEKIATLNKDQKHILAESMEVEVNKLRKSFNILLTVLKQQYTLNRSQGINTSFLEKEKTILDSIKVWILEESDMRKNIHTKLKEVGKLEHSRWFVKLIRGVAKVIIYSKYNLIVEGLENIPSDGPVVIAPRHFHGDMDPSLFYTLIKRRVFFLAATDWMKEGVEVKVNKFIFRKLGAIPMNRPDSIFEHKNSGLLTAYRTIIRYLLLRQVVVIFPEGWPNIDSHYTPKAEDDESIEIKLGVFHFIDYVQKKKKLKVPIIPVGTKYVDHKKFRSDIIVNFGKPLLLPDNPNYDKYQRLLQKEIRKLSRIE